MRITKMSVSRKNVYEECKHKYRFQYHLKTPSPEPEPFYFEYGSAIHYAAELYTQGKGEWKMKDIARDIVTGKIKIDGTKVCGKFPKEYQEKFVKHLTSIQKLTDKIGYDGNCEEEFNYDLDPPNGRMLTGFIDRLIIREQEGRQKAFILDYKTTQESPWRTDKNSVRQDLQLRTYAKVVQKKYGLAAEDIRAALFFLEGEVLLSACFDQDSLDRAEKELRDTFIEIENADPDKTWGNVGQHCARCPWKSMCQFYLTKKAVAEWDGNFESLGFSGW